jgi:hypothetical protein
VQYCYRPHYLDNLTMDTQLDVVYSIPTTFNEPDPAGFYGSVKIFFLN